MAKKQDRENTQIEGIQEPHNLVINEFTQKVELTLPEGDGMSTISIEIKNSKFKKFGPDVRLLRIKRVNGCPLMEII